jgi:2-dehydro-3-deoxygluconokinase
MTIANNDNKVSDFNQGAKPIVCFGEFLLRMSPTPGGEWMRNGAMPVYLGGAELNVATALAKWGMSVKYCTVLPDNYLSKEIINELRKRNIDTRGIQFSGNRIGLYYLSQGADIKNAAVLYDRAHSSFWDLEPGMIDWEKVLEGCSWFHFSAISPGLNQNTAEVCLEAVKAASKKGITISCDLNYRSKLWQYGKMPLDIMPPLVEYCQVVMGNLWAAENLLGIESTIKDSGGKTKEELISAAGNSMKKIHQASSSIASIAYTFRLNSSYFGVMQYGPKMAVSNQFPLENIVDRVGSGDCFMAGLIYGLNQAMAVQEIIDFAASAAVGKLQEKGDATNQSVQSVKNRLNKEWTGTRQ